ncbi:hypothetical protein PSPO01_01289 [Paraphaeosphaeria sporulosa]
MAKYSGRQALCLCGTVARTASSPGRPAHSSSHVCAGQLVLSTCLYYEKRRTLVLCLNPGTLFIPACHNSPLGGGMRTLEAKQAGSFWMPEEYHPVSPHQCISFIVVVLTNMR